MSDDVLKRAKERIKKLLRVLEGLERGDFPYESSRLAIVQLKEQFQGELESISSKENAPQVAKIQYCVGLDQKLEAVLPSVGFLLRSTNTRNAFETYFPLQQLIKKLVADNVSLIFSTEWDYTPPHIQ